ncbi:MAG: L-rhamnose mutarotase [Propionivibrio sp.]
MIRHAFKMKLKQGCEAEYEARHEALWPEMHQELKAAGISDYSIYLDAETLTLFAFQKLADNHSADALPSTAVVKRWWAFMGDIMETNPDGSPVTSDLNEVFHID